MATINSDLKICTLINVFTVKPEKQQELFQLLKEATEKVMSRLPGYISANLHISTDKKQVTNYAQWETEEDFQNMMKNPEAQKHMKMAATIAESFKPVLYDQVWSHGKDLVLETDIS